VKICLSLQLSTVQAIDDLAARLRPHEGAAFEAICFAIFPSHFSPRDKPWAG